MVMYFLLFIILCFLDYVKQGEFSKSRIHLKRKVQPSLKSA
jgi:hypothetical protein